MFWNTESSNPWKVLSVTTFISKLLHLHLFFNFPIFMVYMLPCRDFAHLSEIYSHVLLFKYFWSYYKWYIFNVHRIVSEVAFFVSPTGFVSLVFFNVLQFIQVLKNVSVFSKNQLLVLLGLYNVCFFSMLIILVLNIYNFFSSIFFRCHLLPFPKLFRAVLSSLIFPFTFSGIKPYIIFFLLVALSALQIFGI